MRDPKRIQKILHELARAWMLHPDLRLGQMVLNIAYAQISDDRHLWNLEDDKFLECLEIWCKAYKIEDSPKDFCS